MNRLEFMEQLETLLSDITDSEREEALQYYNDYLNDAGVENEQEVLESLGTPERLAKVIKEGLNDSSANVESGEFSETGYRNYAYEEAEKNEVMKKENKKQMSGGMIALVVILCIFASPLIVAIGSGIFGAGVGILGGILGLVLGIAGAGIALFIVALLLIGIGIGELFSIPLAGICLIGAGLLILGLSVFFIWLTVWMFGSAIPWIVRGIVKIFNNIFHKKGGEAV